MRDESVSKSDDTIIEKEGPPPAPKPVSKPVPPKPGVTMSLKPQLAQQRCSAEHKDLSTPPAIARSPIGQNTTMKPPVTAIPRPPIEKHSVRKAAPVAHSPRKSKSNTKVPPAH